MTILQSIVNTERSIAAHLRAMLGHPAVAAPVVAAVDHLDQNAQALEQRVSDLESAVSELRAQMQAAHA